MGKKINDTEIQSIVDSKLSNSEKLDKISQIYTSNGFLIVSRSENNMQFMRKKEFSFLWALLWFLVFGIGLIVYLLYYFSKNDEIINIQL